MEVPPLPFAPGTRSPRARVISIVKRGSMKVSRVISLGRSAGGSCGEYFDAVRTRRKTIEGQLAKRVTRVVPGTWIDFRRGQGANCQTAAYRVKHQLYARVAARAASTTPLALLAMSAAEPGATFGMDPAEVRQAALPHHGEMSNADFDARYRAIGTRAGAWGAAMDAGETMVWLHLDCVAVWRDAQAVGRGELALVADGRPRG